MPEGHILHRLARTHAKALVDERVAASSPQGRAAGAAAVLDATTIIGVEAVGKHLFYRSAAATLHVHLGLYGRFRTYATATAPAPRPTTRLRLATVETTLDLIGPTDCRVIDPAEEEAILARLGPDPLRPDGEPETFVRLLARRRIPIAAALLDQRIAAGVGNIFRAEALFLAGIDPYRPAAALGRDEAHGLWVHLRAMMRDGLRLGRIVTRDPMDVGARSRASIRRSDALYVYKRASCLRCSTAIASGVVGARTLYWCPACQR